MDANRREAQTALMDGSQRGNTVEFGTGGQELAYVTVTVIDKDGVMAPRGANRLTFELDGPGEIVATDNGDATSLEPFQSTERKAFNGMAGAIVRGKAGQPGTLWLSVKSDGLKEAKINLTSR
jgi:beta-galactosidase